MKYLIQHRKEFAITVTAFIVAVVNLVNAIRNGVLDEDTIIAVIVTAVGILAWYYNMPTSEENSIATGYMRFLKSVKKGEGIGESLADEPEVEEEQGEMEGECDE